MPEDITVPSPVRTGPRVVHPLYAYQQHLPETMRGGFDFTSMTPISCHHGYDVEMFLYYFIVAFCVMREAVTTISQLQYCCLLQEAVTIIPPLNPFLVSNLASSILLAGNQKELGKGFVQHCNTALRCCHYPMGNYDLGCSCMYFSKTCHSCGLALVPLDTLESHSC